MATFKAEVRNKRADGTYNVRIRLTHNGTVRRIPTNVFVVQADITKGKKIRNARILKQCDELIAKGYDAWARSDSPLAPCPSTRLRSG